MIAVKVYVVTVMENSAFFTLELILGAVGAWIVAKYASNLGLLDSPSFRSSHSLPTPKGGGIGILGAFIFGCLVFRLNYLFCLSITFISLLSLLGDRTHISPIIRLFLQFSTAFIIICNVPMPPFYPPLESSAYNFIMVVWAVFFIVGTANFYNFMDGINGIAGITGIIAFGLLAGYGMSHGKDYGYSMLSAGTALACLGFVPFNIPKARVFLGDVGSILLGFFFATITIRFTETFSEFIVLSGFLFPFYADELVTMFERLRNRQGLLSPHRLHLYQVLANEAGVAHWKISLTYGTTQFLVAISLWFVADISLSALFATLFIFSVIFVVINFSVKYCFQPEKKTA